MRSAVLANCGARSDLAFDMTYVASAWNSVCIFGSPFVYTGRLCMREGPFLYTAVRFYIRIWLDVSELGACAASSSTGFLLMGLMGQTTHVRNRCAHTQL